jgi:hypothetical protein
VDAVKLSSSISKLHPTVKPSQTAGNLIELENQRYSDIYVWITCSRKLIRVLPVLKAVGLLVEKLTEIPVMSKW